MPLLDLEAPDMALRPRSGRQVNPPPQGETFYVVSETGEIATTETGERATYEPGV